MNKKSLKFLVGIILFLIPVYSIASIILSDKNYFEPYYDEDYYKRQEMLFNNSQYRQKNPISLIADEAVFRYASGAYMRGVDPILINSEHTPLGKYLIGLSYLLFGTDVYVIITCGIVSLVILWFLARIVMKDWMLAFLPVVLFSLEPLFQNQIRVRPLLDIIQLPFILGSLAVFLYESKKGKYPMTSILLGLVMATKSVVPGALLIICMIGSIGIIRGIRCGREMFRFFLWLPVAGIVILLSYIKTFLDGYSFLEFLRFQKWIIQYQQSKLIYPLSFWKLILFNEWQTWWGEKKIMQAVDWNIMWPIITIVPFFGLVLIFFKKIKANENLVLLFLWIFVYEAFLSLGIISTRFLLPLLPSLYIVVVYIFIKLLQNIKS